MTKDLIIGMGEVGSALAEVFGERRDIATHDPNRGLHAPTDAPYDWMHIVFPYSDDFKTLVASYADTFNPVCIVIHSTVPIGTMRAICKESFEAEHRTYYYSPVRGRHPHLARALRDFPKWYASAIPGQADIDIEAYFARAGMQTRKAPSFEVLELMKLWETTSFAVQLIMWAEIENEMKSMSGNRAANMTAMKNWLFEKRRVYDGDIGLCPVLDLAPGPLGGHCLRTNILLGREYLHPSLYDWLISVDDMRKND